jgi:hypothetical protein
VLVIVDGRVVLPGGIWSSVGMAKTLSSSVGFAWASAGATAEATLLLEAVCLLRVGA